MTNLTFGPVATSIIGALLAGMPSLDHDLNTYECIAHAIYHESRGEDYDGYASVAHVIKTRVEDSRWGEHACSVVNARNFEYISRGRTHIEPRNERERIALKKSFLIAVHVMDHELPDPTNGADHFFKPNVVLPSWALEGYNVSDIGNHRFMNIDW